MHPKSDWIQPKVISMTWLCHTFRKGTVVCHSPRTIPNKTKNESRFYMNKLIKSCSWNNFPPSTISVGYSRSALDYLPLLFTISRMTVSLYYLLFLGETTRFTYSGPLLPASRGGSYGKFERVIINASSSVENYG